MNILQLMFCRWFQVESWSRFWSSAWSIFWVSSLVEMQMFGWDFEVDAWSIFWRWNLIKICVWTCDMNSTHGSVVPLAIFYIQSENRDGKKLPRAPGTQQLLESTMYMRRTGVRKLEFGSHTTFAQMLTSRNFYPCCATSSSSKITQPLH